MNRLAFALSALTALFLSTPARAQMTADSASAPAQNWEMKIFTKEGYRSMILRGTEARRASATRYDVVDLNITVLTGGPEAKVDSILLSPLASFLPNENQARGEKSVRLIRDDMEVTGEQWAYFHAEKKVTIQKNTHVVFHAALPDLLR
jgi:hypothetical protein